MDAEQLSSGGEYLRGTALTDYFEGTEQPVLLFSNEGRGLGVQRDGERTVHTPATGYHAIAAVTNRRVLFVIGGEQGGDGGNLSISLPYTEIRSVETASGILKDRLTITARTGDTYDFFLGRGTEFGGVESYIERAISHWVALKRRLERASDQCSEIEARIDAGEPQAAADAYRHTRELLDQARDVARAFADGRHPMVERVDRLETRLTRAEIRGHRLNASEYRTEAEAARARHDYRNAVAAYTTAKAHYEQALELADEIGTDREELSAAIEAVTASLSGLGMEPLIRLRNACREARQAEGPAPALWKRAMEICDQTHTLCHHDDRFEGDPEALRFQMAWLVGTRLRAHERQARRDERRGDECRARGRERAAREAYAQARDQLQQARAVAREFRAGSPAQYERALDGIDAKTSDDPRWWAMADATVIYPSGAQG